MVQDYSDGELSLTESLQNMSNLPKNSSSPQPETPANTPTDQSYLARRMQMQEADKAKKANLIRSLVSKRGMSILLLTCSWASSRPFASHVEFFFFLWCCFWCCRE